MAIDILKRYVLVALCVALTACATGGGERPAAAGKNALETRAVERWKLLIAGETAAAYDYLSAGVRSTKSREQYAKEMADRAVKWESIEFQSKECDEPAACTVKLLVNYSVEMPIVAVGRVHSPAVIDERWIELDGIWYHVPAEFVPGEGLR